MRPPVLFIAAALSCGVATVAAAAGDGNTGKDGAHMLAMEALTVPIIDGSRADGTLRVKLVLQMADASAVDTASTMLPPLRAASLAAALEFARLYATPMTPVDVERLAGDLTTALHRQDPTVTRVLIVEVAATRA